MRPDFERDAYAQALALAALEQTANPALSDDAFDNFAERQKKVLQGCEGVEDEVDEDDEKHAELLSHAAEHGNFDRQQLERLDALLKGRALQTELETDE